MFLDIPCLRENLRMSTPALEPNIRIESYLSSPSEGILHRDVTFQSWMPHLNSIATGLHLKILFVDLIANIRN